MILVTMAPFRIFCQVLADAAMLLWLLMQPRRSVAAENLFLRRQLAMCLERGVRPRRADPASKITLVLLSRCFDWRGALVNVTPRTFVRWHRQGFRLFWRLKSRLGRPPVPHELRELIRQMASENPSWGQERVANELLVKLGIRVSPRTVRKYMWARPAGTPRGDQRWATFLRNHADEVVACDFFVAVTATFQLLYVFVIMEHESRRLLHFNVTRHPSAQWTLQQFREASPSDHAYQYLIHDRDSVFSSALDRSLDHLGLTVLKTPHRSPKANALCERLIGSIRRECLDFVIPLSERHLLRLLKGWQGYYNQSRPHMGLGAEIPSPPVGLPASLHTTRHRIPAVLTFVARPILGGLHHDYRLVRCAA
jgi:transposase InsO family protein